MHNFMHKPFWACVDVPDSAVPLVAEQKSMHVSHAVSQMTALRSALISMSNPRRRSEALCNAKTKAI